MEKFVALAALFLMPIFAFVFITTFISSLKGLIHNKELQGIEMVVCGISFALMMWTLSSSILLAAG